MSVINKMLRDLDSRQATGENLGHHPASRSAMTDGISVRNGSTHSERTQSFLPPIVAAALVMTLGGAAAAWWYLNRITLPLASAPAVVTPVMTSAPAPLAAASSLAPVTEATPPVTPKAAAEVMPAVAVATLPAVVANPVPAEIPPLKMDSSLKGLARQAAPSRPESAAAPAPAPARQVVPERPLAEQTPTSMSALPAPVTPVPPPSPPRRLPALDALAQAQSLWNAGSHEAAMDLIREAMAVVEKASVASSSSGSNQILASLARELARMELEDGQVSRALDMLTQREAALSDFADIWALRGNAAQRLGRHEESVAAYLMALKLRPNETRWLLGAAVSLAAQGKTASAAELAEKARASGPLSRDVTAYLRQLGVPLRER